MSIIPDVQKILCQLDDIINKTGKIKLKVDDLSPAQVPANMVVKQYDTNSIQARFERFHYGHPEVYEALVRTARALKVGGINQIGIAEMWENMRNTKKIDWSAEEYKLSNDYRSRYARLIHEQEDDLRGFFRSRQLQAK
jgi:hypothetical protein